MNTQSLFFIGFALVFLQVAVADSYAHNHAHHAHGASHRHGKLKIRAGQENLKYQLMKNSNNEVVDWELKPRGVKSNNGTTNPHNAKVASPAAAAARASQNPKQTASPTPSPTAAYHSAQGEDSAASFVRNYIENKLANTKAAGAASSTRNGPSAKVANAKGMAAAAITPITVANKDAAWGQFASIQASFESQYAHATALPDITNGEKVWSQIQSMFSSLVSQFGAPGNGGGRTNAPAGSGTSVSPSAQTSVAGISIPNPKWNPNSWSLGAQSTLPWLTIGGGNSGTATATSSGSSPSSTGSSNGNNDDNDFWSGVMPNGAMVKNNVFIGFLPDDGSGGGSPQTMAQLNKALSGVSATYGYYAQVEPGTPFDGSQLWARLADIKASQAVFQPAIMPVGGWGGLTYSDDSQAVAIAQQMRKFTDQGIEVWLRFAHEVNFYQSDGTYLGDHEDFKEGWAVVARACRKYAPKVKMWFTPNIDSQDVYDKYYPDDPSTVDLIGIDYYPKDASQSFVDAMKPFHDKYTSNTTKFAIGETGLGYDGSMQDRLKWLRQTVSSETAQQLPNLIATSWFNYYKGYDFRIAAVDGDSVVASFIAGH